MGQVNCCRGSRDEPEPEPQHPRMPNGGSGQVADGGARSRRRRWLPWRFVRPGTSAAAEAPGPSGSARTGLLFGRPLADLCSQDGMLPQPMQDLLALLHEQGPSTEGIFRLAASERASREIREALDSGTEVHLASQPVHVLAVILKDFLRKIPSKLLVAELYQQWMAALQKSSREERLVGLKEVARKLPEANLLLLKTLLRLLQNISSNATITKMTALNLAICVGPNLLGPPEEDTLPLDALAQVTGKVTQLVEFLVNHHEELFEDEEEEKEEEEEEVLFMEKEGQEKEEGAGLAGEGAEESPAPGEQGETAEVPAVTAESAAQNSSSGQSSLPGSLQEGQNPSPRKRKLLCEEGDNGQPSKRRRRLEPDSS